jgi:predicted nucleic acid-binding protein
MERHFRPALEGFLAEFRFAVGERGGRSCGRLRAKQGAAGKPPGNPDMLIAARAVSVGAISVTSDKAFSRVANLSGTLNRATDL